MPKVKCLFGPGLRLALACVCIATGLTGPAQAMDDSALMQRLIELEQRVADLEQQLDKKFADDRWKDAILWTRLRPGMSSDNVHDLLGKPARIEQAVFTTWYYHPTSRDHSHVWFDEGKVLGWEGLDQP